MRRLLPLLVALGTWMSAAYADGLIVIKAARLFDGRSGGLLTGVKVIVEGERIAAVGPDGAVPDGARVIDLGDATLLPAFIDAHVHLDDQLQ